MPTRRQNQLNALILNHAQYDWIDSLRWNSDEQVLKLKLVRYVDSWPYLLPIELYFPGERLI